MNNNTITFISLLANIFLLFSLGSPDICYLIHRQHFNWKSKDNKSPDNNEVIDEWLKYQQNKKNKWQ